MKTEYSFTLSALNRFIWKKMVSNVIFPIHLTFCFLFICTMLPLDLNSDVFKKASIHNNNNEKSILTNIQWVNIYFTQGPTIKKLKCIFRDNCLIWKKCIMTTMFFPWKLNSFFQIKCCLLDFALYVRKITPSVAW